MRNRRHCSVKSMFCAKEPQDHAPAGATVEVLAGVFFQHVHWQEFGVFDFKPDGAGMRLLEIAPGMSVEELRRIKGVYNPLDAFSFPQSL